MLSASLLLFFVDLSFENCMNGPQTEQIGTMLDGDRRDCFECCGFLIQVIYYCVAPSSAHDPVLETELFFPWKINCFNFFCLGLAMSYSSGLKVQGLFFIFYLSLFLYLYKELKSMMQKSF